MGLLPVTLRCVIVGSGAWLLGITKGVSRMPHGQNRTDIRNGRRGRRLSGPQVEDPGNPDASSGADNGNRTGIFVRVHGQSALVAARSSTADLAGQAALGSGYYSTSW